MPEQWGRQNGDDNRGLRRGAWYRVVRLTSKDALVEVQHRPVSVTRASLTIVSRLPSSWTVVSRPSDARGLPTGWGKLYAVCPSCRNRAPLNGSPDSMRCGRCATAFRVGWEEWFLGSRTP